MGHVRYEYDGGAWDEWYVTTSSGTTQWISEDQRQVVSSQPIADSSALPALGELKLGSSFQIDGQELTVREIGKARQAGVEGQVPFEIVPGDEYVYAELASANGQWFATLEYPIDGPPEGFIGQVVPDSAFVVTDRPGGVQSTTQAQSITCTNCGGALEVPGGRHIEMQVCEYCGAQLDLTSETLAVIAINQEKLEPDDQRFPIGAKAQLQGCDYEVCGRIVSQDAEGYTATEYLLYNSDTGYRWLGEQMGHFTLSQQSEMAPSFDPRGRNPKTPIQIGGQRYLVYESGAEAVIYVDGALPYRTKVGDTYSYAVMVAPPAIFSAEWDNDEVEYFAGEYIPAKEIYEAFSREESPPKSPIIHGAQPFLRSSTATKLMWFCVLLGAINLGLGVWSLSASGKSVLSASFDAGQYQGEAMSTPFSLTKTGTLSIEMSAPVSNSWIAANFALVNDKQEVIAEMENDVSYYSGYEGGESWTEGSRNSTRYVKAPPAGRYSLLVNASGGSGYSGPAGNEKIYVVLREGAVLSRFFFLAFFLTILFPLLEFWRRSRFESRKWSWVMPDDDDDDDDDWG